MPTEPAAESLLDLLGDEYARTILQATDHHPMTAAELQVAHDMSRPTISRRVNRLAEHRLLTTSTRVDVEGGHHVTVYEAALDRLGVRLVDGEFDVTVELREDAADRFTRLWHQLREDEP